MSFCGAKSFPFLRIPALALILNDKTVGLVNLDPCSLFRIEITIMLDQTQLGGDFYLLVWNYIKEDAEEVMDGVIKNSARLWTLIQQVIYWRGESLT